MSRCTLRNIFTVLIYAGVALFLYPYFTGRLSSGIIFLVAGLGLAILCSVVRCYLTEGDCSDREFVAPKDLAEPNQPQATVPHPNAPSHRQA
jgi:hypothetical protein